jgi:hypothetical protein
MTNIRDLYNNFIVKVQELTYAIGATKRIQIMSEHTDIRPSDILLDIGGNTGKIKIQIRNLQNIKNHDRRNVNLTK